MRQPVVDTAPGSWRYLEHMLERVRRLLPLGHQMLVPFSHHEIQILIRLSRDHAIVFDPLLVVRQCAPSVSMEGFEECQSRAIQSGIEIQGCAGQHDRFYAQDRGRARDEAKCEVSDGRVVVGQRRTGREERAEQERARDVAVGGRIQSALLL